MNAVRGSNYEDSIKNLIGANLFLIIFRRITNLNYFFNYHFIYKKQSTANDIFILITSNSEPGKQKEIIESQGGTIINIEKTGSLLEFININFKFSQQLGISMPL